jgi:hypothetical protein
MHFSRGSESLIFKRAGVSARVSIAATKRYDQKQNGEGRVYLAYIFTSLFIIGASIGTGTGQEPGGRG